MACSLTCALPLGFYFWVQTDPAGTYSAWKANAIGGSNSNNMREFLEKNWANDMDEAAAKKLCMKVNSRVCFLGGVYVGYGTYSYAWSCSR